MLIFAWSVNVIGVIVGWFLIYRTEYLYKISWYEKHKVDHSGKRHIIFTMRFSGVFLILMVIVWSLMILAY